MRGVTIKVVGTIVSMLIVFLIFLWVLITVLGSPECDDLANTTAYNLKVAIDQVSTNQVQSINYGDEPQATEYRTAVIRLCQEDYLFSTLAGEGKIENPADNIYSWILRFSGGEPQYKIYYETFPEGGGMWKESYPWNAGAGSTVVFWGIMRGVSFGIERLSPLIGTAENAGTVWKIFQWIKGTDEVADAVGEASSSVISQYGQPFVFGQTMTQMGKSFLITASGPDNLNISGKNIIFFDSERRNAIDAVDFLNENYSKSIIKSLADSNFIRKTSDGSWIKVGSKIALNNQLLPMIFPRKEFQGNQLVVTEEDAVYVHQNNNMGVLDPAKADWNQTAYVEATRTNTGYQVPSLTTVDLANLPDQNTNNYVLLTYKVSDVVRDQYNELMKSTNPDDRKTAKQLESYWYWDDADVGTTFTSSDVLQTNYGFDLYNIGVQKSTNDLNRLQGEGILTKNTVLHSGDISYMLEGFRKAAFSGDSDSQNIKSAMQTIILDQSNGVFEKICFILGKEPCTSATVSYDDMFDALQSDLSSNKKTGLYHPDVGTGGIMLLWNSYGINVDIKIMDIIMSNPQMRSFLDSSNDSILLQQVKPFNNVSFSDTEILDIYNKQLNWLKNPSGGNGNVGLLPEGMGELYLKRWADTLKQIPQTGAIPPQQQWAVNDIGFIIGLYKQEASTGSAALPSLYQRGITASGIVNKTEASFQGGILSSFVKKEIFWNVQQMITPSSGIAKGFLLSSTEGCLGNSLCVYSHGALLNPEKPLYLNESTKDYFIRLWRPVNPAVAVAGIQGILMHVPSNPRFYVVSPCFAMAKVWKTRYQGEDTIFVKIDKFDLNGTASNYCIADENLINQYATIWTLSDVGRFIESAASWYYGGILTKVINKLDPVSLIQGLAESYISWPGPPFKSLNFSSMSSSAGSNIINRINTK